jgi:hypothetical protein
MMTRDKKASTQRRVIVDLSWPLEASVNAGTALDTYMGENFKLALPTVEDLAAIIGHFGRGTSLWALDLSRAYRQWRADPLDWPLLGLQWRSQFYVDISIAFGLRHGASFAQRVSQSVCDILNYESHTAMPYLDDFVGAEPTHQKATTAFNRANTLMDELGLATNPQKSVPPTTALTWIGVDFDTVTMEMAIPPQVIRDTVALVTEWLGKSTATRHEIQCLLGKLFHSGKCSPPARIFVGRMLATLRGAPPTGTTPLPPAFKADLDWFAKFLPSYNGVSVIYVQRLTTILIVSTTHTQVHIQWGEQACQGKLPTLVRARAHWAPNRQLFSVLVALTLWASHWEGYELQVQVADPTKLQILLHGKSRDQEILRLARAIWLIMAQLDIRVKATTLLAPVQCPQGGTLNIPSHLLQQWN